MISPEPGNEWTPQLRSVWSLTMVEIFQNRGSDRDDRNKTPVREGRIPEPDVGCDYPRDEGGHAERQVRHHIDSRKQRGALMWLGPPAHSSYRSKKTRDHTPPPGRRG